MNLYKNWEEQPSSGDPDDDEDAIEYIPEEVHVVEKQPEEEPYHVKQNYHLQKR